MSKRFFQLPTDRKVETMLDENAKCAAFTISCVATHGCKLVCTPCSRRLSQRPQKQAWNPFEPGACVALHATACTKRAAHNVLPTHAMLFGADMFFVPAVWTRSGLCPAAGEFSHSLLEVRCSPIQTLRRAGAVAQSLMRSTKSSPYIASPNRQCSLHKRCLALEQIKNIEYTDVFYHYYVITISKGTCLFAFSPYKGKKHLLRNFVFLLVTGLPHHLQGLHADGVRDAGPGKPEGGGHEGVLPAGRGRGGRPPRRGVAAAWPQHLARRGAWPGLRSGLTGKG